MGAQVCFFQPGVILIKQLQCNHGLGMDLRRDLRLGFHDLFQRATNFYIFHAVHDAILISQPDSDRYGSFRISGLPAFHLIDFDAGVNSIYIFNP